VIADVVRRDGPRAGTEALVGALMRVHGCYNRNIERICGR